MLLSLFPAGRISIAACQLVDYFNHFRVYVGRHLVFDSYTRYPPVVEVAKCIESAEQDAVPAEIPHSRGIPFSYWRCPEHEGKLVPQQEGGCAFRRRSTQRMSVASSSRNSQVNSETSFKLSMEQQQAQQFVSKKAFRRMAKQ
uniref:Transposase n=1 Tax=Macrostomum lignano TaxID=282301 RepID=A0A1I8GA86_9PLAT